MCDETHLVFKTRPRWKILRGWKDTLYRSDFSISTSSRVFSTHNRCHPHFSSCEHSKIFPRERNSLNSRKIWRESQLLCIIRTFPLVDDATFEGNEKPVCCKLLKESEIYDNFIQMGEYFSLQHLRPLAKVFAGNVQDVNSVVDCIALW